MLSLPDAIATVRLLWSGISQLKALHFKKLIGCIDNQEIN